MVYKGKWKLRIKSNNNIRNKLQGINVLLLYKVKLYLQNMLLGCLRQQEKGISTPKKRKGIKKNKSFCAFSKLCKFITFWQ